MIDDYHYGCSIEPCGRCLQSKKEYEEFFKMKTLCRRTVIQELNKEIELVIDKLKNTNVIDDYEMLALKNMKLVPSIASMNDCDGFCRICDLAKRIRGSYGNAEGMVREYQLLTGGP